MAWSFSKSLRTQATMIEADDTALLSRFHPLVKSTGTILIKGRPVDAAGDAMFVHAIQGMMPNKVSFNIPSITNETLTSQRRSIGCFKMELCILHIRRRTAKFGIHQCPCDSNGIRDDRKSGTSALPAQFTQLSRLHIGRLWCTWSEIRPSKGQPGLYLPLWRSGRQGHGYLHHRPDPSFHCSRFVPSSSRAVGKTIASRRFERYAYRRAKGRDDGI